jgi:hypothetical protein
LGFASCRVAGTFPCIRSGSTPLPDHQPPEPFAAVSAVRGDFLSARGFSTLLPVTQELSELLASLVVMREVLSLRRGRRPFSVLMGLMPCRPEQTTRPDQSRLPV